MPAIRFQTKPDVEAIQWFENGDHPQDNVGEHVPDPMTGGTYERLEGQVVRYFRRPEPEYSGETVHQPCGYTWHDHGWIDTPEDGQTVCPGDWVTVPPDAP